MRLPYNDHLSPSYSNLFRLSVLSFCRRVPLAVHSRALSFLLADLLHSVYLLFHD